MKYSNSQPPEGINTTNEHPLKEFLTLLLGLIALIVIIVTVLSLAAGYVARRVPFETELSLTARYSEQDDPSQIGDYLQHLTDQLVTHAEIPQGMRIVTHYSPADTINAYATLGGNLMFYRGLLEKMPHENALATVMAHEIAHIKHRDPIASIGRVILVQLALNALMGGTDADMVLGSTGLLTLLKFNRNMEQAADQEALRIIQKYYGHIGGATDLFDILHQEIHADSNEPPQFLLSHPQDKNRIENLRQLAARQGWQTSEQRAALPDDLSMWLSAENHGDTSPQIESP